MSDSISENNMNDNSHIMKIQAYCLVKDEVVSINKSRLSEKIQYDAQLVDYWRAITWKYGIKLRCSCCGKLIYIGDTPKIMSKMYSAIGDTKDAHIAHVGHISIEKGDKFVGRCFVTPLCQSCVNSLDSKITLLKGTVICEEKL